jgi:hypothetical protein
MQGLAYYPFIITFAFLASFGFHLRAEQPRVGASVITTQLLPDSLRGAGERAAISTG